jgi:hypothetical protein
MKTFYLFPTLLAVMIQMIANSQTSRMLPVIGVKNEAKTQSSPAAKVYPTIVEEEPAAKQAAVFKETMIKDVTVNEPAPAKAVAVKEEIMKVDNNTFNYYNNPNCYSTKIYAIQLLKEADELGTIESNLRSQAKAKKGAEKNILIKEAEIILVQIQVKQIQASEINGKLNLEKFKATEVAIEKMISKSVLNESMIENAKEINGEAKHQMKMAKEMREEAYAMSNNAAKLGVMGNAEDKENIALKKQDETIAILKATAALCTNTAYQLAMK